MSAQTWTVRRLNPDEWEYHDGNRVRAILQRRKGPSPWTVHRVNSLGETGGCDSFKWKDEAHAFITNGRIFR